MSTSTFVNGLIAASASKLSMYDSSNCRFNSILVGTIINVTIQQ